MGYDVTISVPTFTALPVAGAEASLHIHTQVSEDQIALFGFQEREEKRLFERLITVSGVGPKLAIKMLSGLSRAYRTGDPGAGSCSVDAHSRRGQEAGRTAGGGVEGQAGRLRRSSPQGSVHGPAVEDVLSALVILAISVRRQRRPIENAIAKDKALAVDFDALFRGR